MKFYGCPKDKRHVYYLKPRLTSGIVRERNNDTIINLEEYYRCPECDRIYSINDWIVRNGKKTRTMKEDEKIPPILNLR